MNVIFKKCIGDGPRSFERILVVRPRELEGSSKTIYFGAFLNLKNFLLPAHCIQFNFLGSKKLELVLVKLNSARSNGSMKRQGSTNPPIPLNLG